MNQFFYNIAATTATRINLENALVLLRFHCSLTLAGLLAKRSLPTEEFGSSSLVSFIDCRKVSQQELAAILDENFAAKMQLHTSCYIRTAMMAQ